MNRSICVLLVSMTCVLAVIRTRAARADVTADFEDIVLPGANSYLNGGPNTSTNTFSSRGVSFPNTFTYDSQGDFSYWDGWSISSMAGLASVTTAGVGNQYSAYNIPHDPPLGGGAGNPPSANYAVGFPNFLSGLTVQLPVGYNPASIELTNTTYAALVMRDGDPNGFAKKFGGQSGNDQDYLLVTITGINALGQTVGSTNFYLADYRFADNLQDYIVSHWTPVDVSNLAGARTLSFDFASSDVGMFGINTPTYVAIDDLQLLDVPTQKGDLDLGGSTSVSDIAALMTALSDLQTYQAAHNLTDDQTLALGDFDSDHKVTNLDLQDLIDLLANAGGGGILSSVPEPAGWWLAGIGAAILLINWLPRRLACATWVGPAAARKL
jgi:hypothetical protein